MGLEIEAKYRVDDDLIFSTLPRLASLGRFRFAPALGAEQQHNTYFDTPSGDLAAAGYSLRIREVGERRTATLKRSRSKQGSLRIRDEWEIPIQRSDNPRDWPTGELRDRVLDVIGRALTEPLFTVETQRVHIDAVRDSRRIAVICLDRGSIHAGELAEQFSELEVELAEGADRPAFHALIWQLRISFPLFPEERSKKARGLALRAQMLSSALALLNAGSGGTTPADTLV
jgi:inorganic triphosphatase YgiF